MSNDFDDDFDSGYIDEDESFYGEEENASGGSSQPFLIALIALIAVLVVAVLCISAVVLSRRGSNTENAAADAIIATNAAIEQTNIAVTVAIAATETAKAELAAVQPTFTPEAENSPTPETPPTETPVVDLSSPTPDTAEATTESGEGEAEGTTEAGTQGEGDGEGDGEDGAGGTIVIGATSTPTPTPISAASSGKDSTLPETGLEVWLIALLGLVLIAVLFGARRLRTN